MSKPFDPFDILRDLDPVAKEELGDPAASPEARLALERILAPKRRLPLAVTLRRRKLSYVLLAVVLFAGVGAAAWALTERTSQRRTVGCYQTVDLQAKTVVVALESSPIAACRAVWRQGRLGESIAPRLEACVLPSGAIGVFPSAVTGACRTLELVIAARELAGASTTRLVRLKTELVSAFLAYPCLGELRATEIVGAELAELELTDWRVRVNGTFSPATPCASIAIDDAGRVILVVPVRDHSLDEPR